MRNKTSDSDKRTGTRTDPRPSRILIGTDGEGCAHHFMPHVDAVVVVGPDGRRLWRESLGGSAPIEAWVTHIGERRGWAARRLYDTFGDAVADRVEVA